MKDTKFEVGDIVEAVGYTRRKDGSAGYLMAGNHCEIVSVGYARLTYFIDFGSEPLEIGAKQLKLISRKLKPFKWSGECYISHAFKRFIHLQAEANEYFGELHGKRCKVTIEEIVDDLTTKD